MRAIKIKHLGNIMSRKKTFLRKIVLFFVVGALVLTMTPLIKSMDNSYGSPTMRREATSGVSGNKMETHGSVADMVETLSIEGATTERLSNSAISPARGVTDFSPFPQTPVTLRSFDDDPRRKKIAKKYFSRWAGPRIETVDLGRISNVVEGIRTHVMLDHRGVPVELYIKKLVNDYWPQFGNVTVDRISSDDRPSVVFKVSGAHDRRPIFFIKVSEHVEPEIDSDGKEIIEKQEWENLVAIQQSRIGRLGHLFQRLSNLRDYAPIITNVEKLFTYIDQDNRPRVIAVIHAAKGESVYDVLVGKENISLEELGHWGTSIGRALYLFHSACKRGHKTEAHGDFHPKNILVKCYEDDDDNGYLFYRVYFIDNETMRLTHDKGRYAIADHYTDWDINALIFIPVFYWKWLDPGIMPEAYWKRSMSFFKSYLAGYAEFSPKNKPQLIVYLNSITQVWLNIADKIVSEIEAIAAGNQQNNENSFFHGRITPDSKGNFWPEANAAYKIIGFHAEQDFSDSQINTLNGFIKFVVQAALNNPRKLQVIKKRLQSLRTALVDGLKNEQGEE